MPGDQEKVADAEGQYDEFVFRRLLDEVYLLLDFVSGRQDKSLDDLKGIDIPGEPGPTTAAQVIAHICTLRYPPRDLPSVTARNAGFLLIVKDRLNRMASPA